MNFRLPRDAKNFFRHISDRFPVDFDMYYLCLMAGLSGMRKGDLPSAEASDLVDYFPGEYSKRGRLITALFLACELRKLAIEMTDRKAVQKAVAQMVDTHTPSHLSEQGMREINRYSFGGFEILTEAFNEKPHALETFLPLYCRLLDRLCEEAHAR